MRLNPTILDLPAVPTPETIVRVVAECAPSFFLDSADRRHPGSRFSYAGFQTRAVFSGDDDPWPVLNEALKSHSHSTLVGYLSYESFRFCDPFFAIPTRKGPIPEYWFGLFDPILVIDHARNRAQLVSWFLDEAELRRELGRWSDWLAVEPRNVIPVNAGISLVPRQDSIFPPVALYEQEVLAIQDFLKAGDIYQANLTHRFEVKSSLSPFEIYQRLRSVSPAPYGAFIHARDFQIFSASPELFFSVEGRRVVTRPIKGTRRRDVEPALDRESAQALLNSPKDRAELLMIVDLERNDLGKICKTGTVSVDPICELESFAQVHHLVATVSGELKEGIGSVEALRSVFPGGSVTGAPKKRAIEILSGIEKEARSVYTGAIGFFAPDGSGCFNIPIRTMVRTGERIYLHAGGGIVADSDPRAEYDEMKAKVSGILSALGVS